VHTGFCGGPEAKRKLGKARHRCEDNIKMDRKEVGLGEWTGLIRLKNRDGWRALVNAAMNLRVP
jgi:hypothetical protein